MWINILMIILLLIITFIFQNNGANIKTTQYAVSNPQQNIGTDYYNNVVPENLIKLISTKTDELKNSKFLSSLQQISNTISSSVISSSFSNDDGGITINHNNFQQAHHKSEKMFDIFGFGSSSTPPPAPNETIITIKLPAIPEIKFPEIEFPQIPEKITVPTIKIEMSEFDVPKFQLPSLLPEFPDFSKLIPTIPDKIDIELPKLPEFPKFPEISIHSYSNNNNYDYDTKKFSGGTTSITIGGTGPSSTGVPIDKITTHSTPDTSTIQINITNSDNHITKNVVIPSSSFQTSVSSNWSNTYDNRRYKRTDISNDNNHRNSSTNYSNTGGTTNDINDDVNKINHTYNVQIDDENYSTSPTQGEKIKIVWDRNDK